MIAPGNSFPVIEHPFENKDEETGTIGNSVVIADVHRNVVVNPYGYYSKGQRKGYQSHFTIGTFSTISLPKNKKKKKQEKK